jgi:hypothetical protein
MPVTYVKWPQSDASPIPSNPTVEVLFKGLLALCFDYTRQCEVGICNRSQAHSVQIRIWKKTASGCYLIYENLRPTQGLNIGEFIRINVINPIPLVNGVYVYTKNGFDRNMASGNDPSDFGWSLNIEGNYFHDRKVNKHVNYLRPSLLLNNGLFFTYHKTESTFDRIRAGDQIPLNNIAFVLGANIYLDSRGSVSLDIPRVPDLPPPLTPLDLCPDERFQIIIGNDCDDEHGYCGSDFHHHYKTINETEWYNLNRSNEVPDPDPPLCGTHRKSLTSTTRTPCTGIVFGESTGID